MKVYEGRSESGRKTVTVDGKQLSDLYSSDIRRNVPFDWGTQPPSPGAVHLAEALFFDHFGNSTQKSLARAFANDKLATLSADWKFGSEQIDEWVQNRCRIGYSASQAGLSFNLLNSLHERIKPDELVKHGFPRPNDVRLSQSTDSTGEEAYYVYLVFPDRTPEEALAWKKIEPMVSWVRNLIWTETGTRLWPYVKVKRYKELAGGLV
jgi:hypothetical protein